MAQRIIHIQVQVPALLWEQQSKRHHTFYYNTTDWSATRYDNLWSADNIVATVNDSTVVKSVYDPNPVGFKMPATKAWDYFILANAGTFNKGYSFPRNDGSGATTFVPAAGSRYNTGGTLGSVDSYGYYWSARPNSETYGYHLHFSSGSVNPLNVSSRYTGRSVKTASE